MRVRGLKGQAFGEHFQLSGVALYASAWIESCLLYKIKYKNLSHSMRVRGLKEEKLAIANDKVKSHSMRVRGLKVLRNPNMLSKQMSHSMRVRGLKVRFPEPTDQQALVALYASAWIESAFELKKYHFCKSHST